MGMNGDDTGFLVLAIVLAGWLAVVSICIFFACRTASLNIVNTCALAMC